MIGIVLAGGAGTRLYPLTKSTSKQLLPVYDKPMIYYPIATLMLAGIREIILITTPQEQLNFKKLLGDGSQFGVNFQFIIQVEPKGLAQAFTLTANLISGEKTALALGDNIFHGTSLGTELRKFQSIIGAQIFGYHVANPQDYGVVTLNSRNKPIKIDEKPLNSKSNLAIPGLYFYDETVFEKAANVKMSPRGEFEITSINQMYLDEQKLKVEVLPRGTAWLDTGSFETLYEASSFVRVLQERQGYKIGCLEEIALRNGWITAESLRQTLKTYSQNSYTNYLSNILNEINPSEK
jgi:glucose-1-phosphate thymidylyltransferase